MRNIDITHEDIRCTDELCVTDDNLVEATYELWFDVDAYFGTNIRANDGMCINFYTYYSPTGSITAEYSIIDDNHESHHIWMLTEEEKIFFKRKMEAYCQQLYGQSLDEFREEVLRI